jgi:hypothetical protein
LTPCRRCARAPPPGCVQCFEHGPVPRASPAGGIDTFEDFFYLVNGQDRREVAAVARALEQFRRIGLHAALGRNKGKITAQRRNRALDGCSGEPNVIQSADKGGKQVSGHFIEAANGFLAKKSAETKEIEPVGLDGIAGECAFEFKERAEFVEQRQLFHTSPARKKSNQKRVALSFPADRRPAVMARADRGLIGQGQQFRFNSLDQSGSIAAGQVAAAD